MIEKLTKEQLGMLESMKGVLKLAADIAQAKISLLALIDGKKGGARPKNAAPSLYVYDQAEPFTRLEDVPLDKKGQQTEDSAGQVLRLEDEPLIARSIEENIVTEGMREFIFGQYERLKVYPVSDSRGRCFAAVSFEDREADVLFWDNTMDFLRCSRIENAADPCYRRLAGIDGLVLVDGADQSILAANNVARHIFRALGVGKLIGRPANSLDIHWMSVGEVIAEKRAVESEVKRKGLILDVRFLPLVFDGKVRRIIAIMEDVTQLRVKDEELRVKSAVIREIHHRVKNNLQTMASLLRLEQRRAQSAETRRVLRESINRISSIALVHEYLSGQGTERVNMAELAREIFRTVVAGMADPQMDLKTHFKASPMDINSQKAASLALVLNELLQNALEHAFIERDKGTLSVEIYPVTQGMMLTVTDDGVGLPKDFRPEKSRSLGLKIIQTVVKSDLKGAFFLKKAKKGGTRAEVLIPRG